MGVPDGYTFFNVAFAIVLFSLILQGWTIRPTARMLGLQKPKPPENAE
jgi:cell volume regulation protein A